MKKIILSMIMVFSAATICFADNAGDIMEKVLDRDDGTTEISRISLSTCRYVKKGKKTVCAEKPRVKVMDTVRKDYGPQEKDHRSVSTMIEPLSERGIGFLQYDYEDRGKDTDQWIYLSAMGKVKRIVSGNSNEPKTGSFFGSELSYEDMEKIHLEDYTYKILGKEKYRGKECWVIESLPTIERAGKSNYSKSMDWVDRENHMVLKSILFSRTGKKVKKIYIGKIESINGVLVARQMIVNNIETKRRTVMTIEKITLNKTVPDEFLTQRTLTDGAFRERNLKKFQKDLR